ncbi:MAG: SRPBCC domain-containing protein, partial [Polyangiales bacterium]
MDTEEFNVSSVIPASPNRIYSAWMDERHHSAITGARATVDPWVGGRVIADDGFIDATHVYLVTGSRIAMTWRTRDFPKGSNDSQVDITFAPVAGGTKVEVTHSKIPPGLAQACEKIWTTLYLGPMAKYFGEPDAMRAAYKAAKKAGHLPLSGIKASRPGPRRPFVPAPKPPVEEPSEDEDDDEEKPKKTRKRIETKTIDLRELARAQAKARKLAARKKADSKKKAEAERLKAEAARKAIEAKKKAEALKIQKAEARRIAAEKKRIALEKKRAAAMKKAELARKKAEAKKKAYEIKRKKAAAKKKAEAKKKAAAQK